MPPRDVPREIALIQAARDRIILGLPLDERHGAMEPEWREGIVADPVAGIDGRAIDDVPGGPITTGGSGSTSMDRIAGWSTMRTNPSAGTVPPIGAALPQGGVRSDVAAVLAIEDPAVWMAGEEVSLHAGIELPLACGGRVLGGSAP